MKYLIPILFFLIFTGILLGTIIYLSRKFSWYFNIEKTGLLYILFTVLSVFMIAGVMIFTNSSHPISSIIYNLSAVIMGFMIYLLLSVLIIDVVHIFIKTSPKIYGIIALILPVVITTYGIWNASNTKLTQIEIPLKGLQKEIKAMHLSDIHIGHSWGVNFLQKIVNESNDQQPDVVFITGDLFDGRIKLSPENLKPLTQLTAPTYFVEGNHDGYTGVDSIKKLLRQINIRVLENEVTEFGELQLIGLNHMLADKNTYDMHAVQNGSTIKSVMDTLTIDKDKPSVLLHHSPDGIKYVSNKGIDLYLAGHTHAGQLFPINIIAGWIFAYNKGLHDFNGTKIYVSEGAGTFGPPMRVGTKSEITLITLKPIP